MVARGTQDGRTRWFDAYLTTLIQRDLRDLSSIEGITHLPRLLQGVALRAGSGMNVADLGRSLGLNQVTLKRYYMTLFETLFLMVQLPPWFDNLGKRLAKTAKVYFNDSGLLAHLLGLELEAFASLPASFGAVKGFGCSRMASVRA